jgi:glutamate synthase domain-containing protein 3
MTNIDASMLDFRQLNAAIRDCTGDAAVTGCSGQRFIGAGLERGKLILSGTPGNALGAYLNGASIEVCGNAQDAVGDTMNAGRIVVRGSIGDAAGYAMRGGELYVQGNAGYRAGIHMKAYGDKLPVMVIGGKAGSFLGEYQAGGVIVVLGLTESARPIVSNFPCTGMHGGKLFLRSDCKNILLPKQVIARPASHKDLDGIWSYLHTFCELFGGDCDKLVQQPFTLITPNSSNPYKQLYVTN